MPILFLLITLLNFTYCSSKTIDLSKYEQKIYSQNGEDGVIEAIFKFIGTTNQYYVEFGTESGIECNTRNLLVNKGWSGLLMDGKFENSAINLKKEFITAENINNLFAKYNIPKQFDLLSIDIDFNDFYVWKAIDKKRYSPRVVVIEYNASHLPHEDKIVQYDPNGSWDGTYYFGASILALYNLGKTKGYTLVYADKMGINLFFIRDDILKKLPYKFKNAGSIEKIYNKFGYNHRPDHLNRPYASSKIH